MTKTLIILLITILPLIFAFSQDDTDTKAKYLSWAILQTMPSPVYIQDSDDNNARIQFGLRWHLTPINISFRANKYISPVQFFVINPVRKFTGSIELFVQPEWTTSSFKYAGLARFGISTGTRLTLPVSGEGQNLSVSFGGKYSYRKDLEGDNNGYFGVETGIYVIYGILGFQFNYNFDSRTRYNFGLYFKYF